MAGNKADNHRRLDTSRNYQWHGGLGRASWHLERDARRHCAGSGKGQVDGALGRSINSRDQQWTHFHAITCSSRSSHYIRVQSIALVGVEVALYSKHGAQAKPFARASLSVTPEPN